MKKKITLLVLLVLFSSYFFCTYAISERTTDYIKKESNSSSFSLKLDDTFSETEYYVYLDEPATLEISVIVGEWGEIILDDDYTGLGILLIHEKDMQNLNNWLITARDKEKHFLITEELKPGIYILQFVNKFVQEIVFSWNLNLTEPIIWTYNSFIDLAQTNRLYFSLERIPDHFTELKKLYVNINFYGKNISNLDIMVCDQSNNAIFSETYQGPVSSISASLKLSESIQKAEWFSISFNETYSNSSSFASIMLFYDHATELNIVRLFFVKVKSSIFSIPIDFGKDYSFKIKKWYESDVFLSFLSILVIFLKIVLYAGPPFLVISVIIVSIVLRKRKNKKYQSFESYPSIKYKKAEYAPENAIRVDFSSIPKDFRIVGTSQMKPKCSICFQSINNLKNSIRCPSCDNIFHKNHLYQWIIQKGTCPTCKTKLRIAT
ncbi:MAG: E3 ubiquitin protein ligase [Candidatus Heimdallarchaeum aukensis]|uniref:E3 ubiquitin protein ligase n=1 Tax=Candidatus Heimdallarchaeum aukensis TaxID=2876573 RepID=A0A9Y1BMG5_9ARCH|nr:MAG: E3 ubiquitin protein ligase [Candidatus Heimdallarchaeum aukensis]